MIQPVYKTSHQLGPYPPWVILLLLGFIPAIGLGLIALGIYATYVSIAVDNASAFDVLGLLILILSVSSFYFALGWALISKGMARYNFETDGLQVKFPLRSPYTIPWDEFQQVCIVHAAFTTRGERRANTVICCVMKGEKKNFYDRWKTDNPFKYRTVLCIEYSPELHAGIKERCPYEVRDLRDTPAYRLI